MGGGVKGGQVLGKYPDRLDPVHSDENDGRARMIPSTPWESIWNGIAEWYGVDEVGREAILPMMKNFESDTIFSASQLFEGNFPTGPTPPPTGEPTPPPTVPLPTAPPTEVPVCQSGQIARRRRNADMCKCRRRAGRGVQLDVGWNCEGDTGSDQDNIVFDPE